MQHHHGDVLTYLLEDVITPTALYWGDNDWLAAPEDILNTIRHLPNVLPGMNHEVGVNKNLSFFLHFPPIVVKYKIVAKNTILKSI